MPVGSVDGRREGGKEEEDVSESPREAIYKHRAPSLQPLEILSPVLELGKNSLNQASPCPLSPPT